MEGLGVRLSLASNGQLPGEQPALSAPEYPLLSSLSFCEQNQQVLGSQCEDETTVFLSLREWMDMLTSVKRYTEASYIFTGKNQLE